MCSEKERKNGGDQRNAMPAPSGFECLKEFITPREGGKNLSRKKREGGPCAGKGRKGLRRETSALACSCQFFRKKRVRFSYGRGARTESRWGR